MLDLYSKLLLACTKYLPLPQKTKWKVGMRDEVHFWDNHMKQHYVRKADGTLSPEADFRLSRTTELQPQFAALLQHLPQGPLRLIDVGSGPFSLLGKTLPGRDLEIVAVDPLAKVYAQLMDKHGIIAPLMPKECDGERLTTMFDPGSFHLAHANNCLDHAYDPIAAIEQMFQLVKPGCSVYLRHEVDVAVGADYVGMHQWNFRNEGGKFWISNKNRQVNVCMDEHFAGRGELSLSYSGHMMVNIIRKLG
ncbi:MAG: hypothetical protein IPJ76_00155 [Flavobacteriales bacterium]|nr:MAG: hypothetical protein IPJ76_00155 [Flavobacteriales bacterium]